MRRCSFAIACAFPWFGPADTTSAQSTAVWPPGYATRAGGSSQAAPFTISGARERPTGRSVTTFAAASVPFGAGSVIHEIAYRRDSLDPATYPTARGWLRVDFGAVHDAQRITSAVQHVWTSARSTTAFKGTIDLPTAPPPTTGPAPFDLVIPLRFPWTWSGGDFAIDLAFQGEAGKTWRRDAARIHDGHNAGYEPYGNGCAGSNGLVPFAFVDLIGAVPGGFANVHLSNALRTPQNGLAVNMLGLTQSPPLPLGPFGFPPACRLHVQSLASLSAPTGDRSLAFSRSLVRWPIPNTATLTGVTLATQWLVLDPGYSTAVPATSSNAIRFTIGRASSTASVNWGRSLWLYGYRLNVPQGGELSPPNYVAITRFGGTLLP
jgi:hypothetical protein